MATTLSLDQYAELQADVEAGRPRDEVLARAGLSVEEWTAAQRQWLDTMGSELLLGSFELSNRYSLAFLARQRFLASPAPSPTTTATASNAAPQVEAVRVPVEATPTYLAASAAPPLPPLPMKRAPAALAGTSMGFVAPRGPALPFAAGAPTSPPVVPPEATASEAAPNPPARKRAPPALAGTSMGFVAPLGPALPFAKAARVDDPRPDAPLASEAIPAPPAPSPARAAPTAVAPPPPTLSLQQYASLCAELAVFPGRSEATFQQYGLGNMRDRLTVDLAWQERLRRNPAEHQGWQALHLRWVEHFQQMKQEVKGEG